jgi:CxxC motif-containing protein (DUF1111 family)
MRRAACLVALAYAAAGVAAADLASAPEILALLGTRPGGDATTAVQSASAFTQHPDGLDAKALQAFAHGNRIFSTPWVEAPASVRHFDGLGPYFSSRSCSGCHVHDGRGRPPEGPEDSVVARVVKLGRADASARGSRDPHYGVVLSDRAVRALAPEGRLVVHWEELERAYADGTRARLRRPRFQLAGLAYGPLAEDTRASLRVAPAVFGVGLLEAVPESLLGRLADPADANSDGISGRIHAVRTKGPGTTRPGRFGWKATQASVAGQVTTALVEDMGITTEARPEADLGVGQRAARARPQGGRPELERAALEALVTYCRLLAVPARRDLDDPSVRRGAARFREAGCVSCHVPSLVTADAVPAPLARQVIHPFTDLLLHDLGPELSDGMPEQAAAASEWRTPPLWGLGLVTRVNGHRFLLHDGRARTPEEAILWHGGEAQASRDAFRALTLEARRDLLRFLESL